MRQDIEEKVITLYKQPINVSDIAKQLSISIGVVYYVLRKKGILLKKTELSNSLMEQIAVDSANGITLADISIKYNIEKTRLCRLINSFNLSDVTKQTIINLNKVGQNPCTISQRLSVTTEAVLDVLCSYRLVKVFEEEKLTEEEILEIRTSIERALNV